MPINIKNNIRLDKHSSAPLYQQLVSQVIGLIEAGNLKAGVTLPTTRSLVKTLKLNRNTIVKAYSELSRMGYLKSRVGSGSIVTIPDQAVATSPVNTNRKSMAWMSMLSRTAQKLPHRDTVAAAPGSIRLSRMQPSEDLLPLHDFKNAISSTLSEPSSLIYAPSSGITELREVVLAELANMGVQASMNELIITNGSSQALDLTLRSLIDPGDKIILEDPTYHGGIMLLKLSGAELVPLSSDNEGPDIKHLPPTVTQQIKACYLIPNYRNPTSTSISDKRRQEIATWAKENNILIIEDDYGSELALDERAPKPIKHYAPNHCIYLNSFSKRLFPALRLGYMVVPPGAIAEKLHTMKWTIDLGCSAILQGALAEFIKRGDYQKHLDKVLIEYKKRREIMHAVLKKSMPASIKWQVPKGGLFFWLSLPPTINVERLIELSASLGVEISGGHAWSATGANLSGIRITFCSETAERIEKGVQILANACRELLQEPTTSSINNLSDNYV